MKQLWILRHGKAAEKGPGSADRQRPLAEEGREQSREAGEFLRNRGATLDRVVCSSALRTKETAEAVLAAGRYQVPLELTDRVYEAGGSELLKFLRGLKDSDSSVLLVGHMPGLGELLSLLVTEQDDPALVFRPGTLALVLVDIDRWAKAGEGKGALAILLPPRQTG